ncbi:hypothetical protein PIIN_05320 [Serendipita indica DSM 11827]|uniref:Uncharacterized protein n=1 Tax=Serendipita indica (strain DSM 11827) TaxID=1109443 RepID=G4TJ88_SERID|nr:hypothetical protein PIIN_05320 [Serendipita indica DSM 11827]
MAVLQFAKATKLTMKILELENGKTKATRQHGFFILMSGFHLFKRDRTLFPNKIEENGREEARLLGKESAVEAGDSQCDHTPNERRINVVEEVGNPVHPLDEFDVFRLIEAGKLCLPPSTEPQDRCKSDGLAKFLFVVQTLWFIAQFIARKVSKLPLTKLEVITLGYTLLTVAMYIAWWDKPYRVTSPIRVYETLPECTKKQEELKRGMEETGFVSMAIWYAAGAQGGYIDLRSVRGVPLFHSGYIGKEFSDLSSLLTTIIVGTLFGAVHFLAWSSPFPSTHMQFLWRFATIVMTAVPSTTIVITLFGVPIGEYVSKILGALILFSLFLLPPLYFVGRGITIVLALVTLATLPLDAYRDVEWSDFFPHI